MLNTEIYDEIITVSNEDAFATGRLIGKTIVVLLPDTGGRYLSTPLFEE